MDNFIKLPCGKTNECCKIECPNKNNEQIEKCYSLHMRGYYRKKRPDRQICKHFKSWAPKYASRGAKEK